MQIGTSLLLIAVGSILTFAVNATVSGLDINTIGVILMVVGVIGLLLSLFLTSLWAGRREVVRDRRVGRERDVF